MRIYFDKSETTPATIFPLRDGEKTSCAFFLPGLGGSAFYAHKLVSYLHEEIQAYELRLDQDLIEYISRGTMQGLAERLAMDLHTVDLSKAYHLVGHSFGGFLAYETAHQLERLGSRVGMVAILDSAMPTRFYSASAYFRAVAEARKLKRRAHKWVRTSWQDSAPTDRESILELPGVGRIDLRTRPKSLRYIIENLHGLMRNYRPSLFDVDIMLFKAMSIRSRFFQPRYLGWDCISGGRIDLFHITGGHNDLVRDDDAAKQVANIMSSAILEHNGEDPIAQ